MEEMDYQQKKVILRAMHLLERMDRTEQGLRDKLTASQYPPQMIDNALEYVKSYGYIDDERYARNYIRYRLESKSRRQLFQELRKKGVDAQIITDAWEEIAREEQPDEKQLIRRLVQKKCQGRTQLSDKEYGRLQGYLGRRGFSWEDISTVLRQENIEYSREQ